MLPQDEYTKYENWAHKIKRIAGIILVLVFAVQIGAWGFNRDRPATIQAKPIIDDALFVRVFLDRHNIETVEQYAEWLNTNMVYQADVTRDEWTAPMETLIRQYGDCEDLSFLTAEVLKNFGYEPRVLAAEENWNAHAFVVFVKDGTYHIFDNIKYVKTQVTTMKEIMGYVYKKHNSEFLVELLDQDRKQIKILYIKNKYKNALIEKLQQKQSS